MAEQMAIWTRTKDCQGSVKGAEQLVVTAQLSAKLNMSCCPVLKRHDIVLLVAFSSSDFLRKGKHSTLVV